MSLESDVQYWERRNWDAISQVNQVISQTFEKAKKVYSQAVKEGIIEADDPNYDFKFQTRKWTKTTFSVDEVIRALVHLDIITDNRKEITKERLTDILNAMNPSKDAYYLKFR